MARALALTSTHRPANRQAQIRVRRFNIKLRQPSNCILTTAPAIMNTLRIARAAVRARPAAIARPLQRRGYAEVASDKIKLSLALPHQVRITSICQTCRNPINWKHAQENGADKSTHSRSTSHRMCTFTTAGPTIRESSANTDEMHRIACRSTSQRKPATWVSWPTTCRPLSN